MVNPTKTLYRAFCVGDLSQIDDVRPLSSSVSSVRVRVENGMKLPILSEPDFLARFIGIIENQTYFPHLKVFSKKYGPEFSNPFSTLSVSRSSSAMMHHRLSSSPITIIIRRYQEKVCIFIVYVCCGHCSFV